MSCPTPSLAAGRLECGWCETIELIPVGFGDLLGLSSSSRFALAIYLVLFGGAILSFCIVPSNNWLRPGSLAASTSLFSDNVENVTCDPIFLHCSLLSLETANSITFPFNSSGASNSSVTTSSTCSRKPSRRTRTEFKSNFLTKECVEIILNSSPA